MIETFKILNAIYNISPTGYWKRRRHSAQLFKKRSRLDIRKNYFQS